MTKVSELPSAQFLNECLTYDPQTGELFWKVRPRSHFNKQRGWTKFNALSAGKLAGSKSYKKNGDAACIRIGITFATGKNKLFVAHRIIYRLMNVEVPSGMQIDHQDLNPFNNAWHNLRIASQGQNLANKRAARTKKSGLPKGVGITPYGKFVVTMKHDGKSIHVGCYGTPEEAHAAYCAKAKELHGEFARFN